MCLESKTDWCGIGRGESAWQGVKRVMIFSSLPLRSHFDGLLCSASSWASAAKPYYNMCLPSRCHFPLCHNMKLLELLAHRMPMSTLGMWHADTIFKNLPVWFAMCCLSSSDFFFFQDDLVFQWLNPESLHQSYVKNTLFFCHAPTVTVVIAQGNTCPSLKVRSLWFSWIE